MHEHWIPFPTRPKAAFQLSPLHSLIALIILCNSRCFLCPHFYRRILNAMVRLWLWNLGTLFMLVQLNRGYFCMGPRVGCRRFLVSVFRKRGRATNAGGENQRERGGYEVLLRTFTATPRINTLFSCGGAACSCYTGKSLTYEMH